MKVPKFRINNNIVPESSVSPSVAVPVNSEQYLGGTVAAPATVYEVRNTNDSPPRFMFSSICAAAPLNTITKTIWL